MERRGRPTLVTRASELGVSRQTVSSVLDNPGVVSAETRERVLAAIRREDRSLAELCADLRLYPQTLINVRVERGFDWQKHEGLQRARREVEAELGDAGRILIRPSGTEPLLRVMVEARDEGMAQGMAKRLAESVGAPAAAH